MIDFKLYNISMYLIENLMEFIIVKSSKNYNLIKFIIKGKNRMIGKFVI